MNVKVEVTEGCGDCQGGVTMKVEVTVKVEVTES